VLGVIAPALHREASAPSRLSALTQVRPCGSSPVAIAAAVCLPPRPVQARGRRVGELRSGTGELERLLKASNDPRVRDPCARTRMTQAGGFDAALAAVVAAAVAAVDLEQLRRRTAQSSSSARARLSYSRQLRRFPAEPCRLA
jgi:hypothetical protein